jgi:hypothetical protein
VRARYAPPPCDQRLASFSTLNGDLQDRARALIGLKRGLVLAVNRSNAGVKFQRQGLGQRPFHYPLQTVELVKVEGHLVVFRQAPELLLKTRHDAEGRILDEFRPVNRFLAAEVAGTFRLHNGLRHFQPDPAVDAAVTASIELVVVVEAYDFVAEKTRGVCPRVGDQGFGLREFQFEMIAQEFFDGTFDLFGFASWAAETEQPIVGIADVA